MRRVISSVLFLLVLGGCVRRWTETEVYVTAVNWTSDNKVVFVKEVITWQCEEIPPFISERAEVKSDEFYLCEINYDGTGLREICYLWDRPGGINAISSAGEWIVFSDNIYREIYVIKRDGTGLEKVGYGVNPDFSPDASRIVYEKPDSGIWIMDRDGNNNHCIVPDPDAKYPAWSPDDTLIAYVIAKSETLHICDIFGNILKTYTPLEGGWYESPDWAPKDTNAVIVAVNGRGWSEIVYLSNDTIKKDKVGWYAKWSPDGSRYISYDGSWYVIRRDGTNKWYLKDKIAGGER